MRKIYAHLEKICQCYRNAELQSSQIIPPLVHSPKPFPEPINLNAIKSMKHLDMF